MWKSLTAIIPLFVGSAAIAQHGLFFLESINGSTSESAWTVTPNGQLLGGELRWGPFDDGEVALWSTDTRHGVSLGRPDVEGPAYMRALAADARTALVRVDDGADELWYLWRQGAGFSELPADPSWNVWSASDLSRDGSDVAGFAAASGGSARAIVWRDGTPQELPSDPDWSSSRASAFAPGGAIYGSARVQGGATAVRWSGDTADELFTLPTGGLISSVSGDERFLYGNSMQNGDPLTEAPFRWSEDAGVEQLPVAPGAEAGAVLGITFDGGIAVGYSLDSGFETAASVWIDGQPLSFGEFLAAQGMNSTGWDFDILTAISDDGNVVVGYGTDPSGRFGTFVAIVPAPPAMLGLLMGALARGYRRR